DELHDALLSMVLVPAAEVEAAGWMAFASELVELGRATWAAGGMLRWLVPAERVPVARAAVPGIVCGLDWPAAEPGREEALHALPLPLAARAAGDAAPRPRRAPRGDRPAPGARAAGARLGDPGAAGAHRALRPRRSRRPLSRGCGGMGSARDRSAAGGGLRSPARQGTDARGAAR